MKLTLCLLLSFAAFAFGGVTVDHTSIKGWFVPRVDGSFAWMPKEQFEMETAAIQPRAVTVKFYLYTNSNQNSGRLIPMNDGNALSSGGYNKGLPTRILIHGWQSDLNAGVNTQVRSALFATGNYNVICVDWSSAAVTINYASARYSVSAVGQEVANFMDFLNSSGGMAFSNVGIVGHSLGAHVSGYAGKLAKRGKVARIEGLDPALPLFSYNDCSTRLCSTDATYVESIQTNGGLLGFLDPIGKAAFYPNGGKNQPGCGMDATGGCAHERSVLYYAEAIRRNDFPSMKCSTFQNAVADNCGSTYSSVRMGATSNNGINGYYYVPVKSSSPYGMAS